MEGAASGERTAAAGLSVPAAVPIDKGQLFPTRGAARNAAETELAAAGRAIKNGSLSEKVTFWGMCSGVTARASGMQLHCCRDISYPLKQIQGRHEVEMATSSTPFPRETITDKGVCIGQMYKGRTRRTYEANRWMTHD